MKSYGEKWNKQENCGFQNILSPLKLHLKGLQYYDFGCSLDYVISPWNTLPIRQKT